MGVKNMGKSTQKGSSSSWQFFHLYGTNGCQEHGQEHAKGQQQQQLFLALEAV